MISRTTEYAITALATLARFKRKDAVLVREIAEASGVPHNYLSKILGELRRHRLVDSERGPGGGFKLAKSAQDISIFDIVEIFEDMDRQQSCFLGHRYCADQGICRLGARWKDVWVSYERFLRDSTLAELAFHEAMHPRKQDTGPT